MLSNVIGCLPPRGRVLLLSLGWGEPVSLERQAAQPSLSGTSAVYERIRWFRGRNADMDEPFEQMRPLLRAVSTRRTTGSCGEPEWGNISLSGVVIVSSAAEVRGMLGSRSRCGIVRRGPPLLAGFLCPGHVAPSHVTVHCSVSVKRHAGSKIHP